VVWFGALGERETRRGGASAGGVLRPDTAGVQLCLAHPVKEREREG